VKKILLVEDEVSIAEVIKFNLEDENYFVVWEKKGRKAVDTFFSERFDLIVLDVMLPEMNGFDVCETIRLKNDETPILFLTARNDQKDKILGLKLGGDDYLTKPFDLEEFLLRVKNIIKRSSGKLKKELSEYKFGKNIFIPKTLIVKNEKDETQLSKKEGMLLKLLLEHPNEVISRETILEKVWGFDVYPSTRTIDNFIVKLRKFFENDPKNPKFFHSVRGIGYKFTP
jgi:two-component system alkaline phosphatase synthesis response regulator PhoP